MDVASIDAALEIAVEPGAKVALPATDMGGRRNYGSRRQHLRSLGANQKVDLVLRRTEQVAKMVVPDAVQKTSYSI